MVDSKTLIDTTFLFDTTHKAFLGAEIFRRDGTDVTYAFGFLRDVLRLRQKLEIRRALLIIGKEAYAAAPQEKVKSIVALLNELGLPTLYEPKMRVLDIGNSLAGKMTHVLSHDKSLLQLANGSLRVLLPNASGGYVEVNADEVKSYLGVAIRHVPTFLTLTQGPKASRMTKWQSIRLIELHGELDQLYNNLEQVKSSQLRVKLADHEKRLRTMYVELQLGMTKIRPKLPNLTLKLDNQKTRRILRSYGFYSLTRLLQLHQSTTSTNSVTTFGTNGRKQRTNYQSIVDRAGLQRLEAVILDAEHCAVDTESDDKDPHRATLFGVSFSVKKSKAYFVSMLEKDLKGISPEDVTKSLRKILGSDIKFVGHNIKYDYVLLRRHSVRIKTVHFDTMLAAYDCFGDWDFFNLPYLAEKLLNRKIKSYKDVVGKDRTFLELPFREIVQHACEDADIALQLQAFLQKELEAREISDQFLAATMPLLRDLGELEYLGVRASSKCLEMVRDRLAEDATRLKELALKEIGTSFDLDSQKALELIVRDSLNLKSVIGMKKINATMLEQLAICNEPLKLVVKYRRAKKRLSAVDAIIKCVDRHRVHPVFNQIRAKHGRLSSKNPNMFDVENVSGLADSFGKEIRGYFGCPMGALDTLQEVAGDEILQDDRSSNDRENAFLARHTVTSKLEPVECDEILLDLALGRSDFELSKRFLLDRMSASTIRHDAEVRYRTLFKFLEKFRSESAARGYACRRGKRKYLAGLKSSSLGKRQKAQEYAVRWLLQW